MGLLEVAVGLVLVLFGVIAVILFIVLCWGLVWKLLLSRLGLFKELFSDIRGEKGQDKRKTERTMATQALATQTTPTSNSMSSSSSRERRRPRGVEPRTYTDSTST